MGGEAVSIAEVDDRTLVRPEERPYGYLCAVAGQVPGEEHGLTFSATQLKSVDNEHDP